MSATLTEYQTAPEFTGVIAYEPNWYLLLVPAEVHQSLLALLPQVEHKPAAKPHVSVMKEEVASRNAADWGAAFVGEEVRVKYAPTVRAANGLHFWLDCHSSRLCEMREHFGLPTLRRTSDGAYLVNFHLTLGRRRKALPATPVDQIRVSPQSHIDPTTGMQHL